MDTKLQQMIENFLAERRESDGGYAPVTDSDFQQLDAIITVLVNAKFDEDPDGDLPIEWMLINRHTHLRLHFRPLRYDHQIEGWGRRELTPKERIDAQLELHHAVTLNSQIAEGHLEHYHNHIERMLLDQKELMKQQKKDRK